MIAILCPACSQKHGEIQPIDGVTVVHAVMRCKNIHGCRQRGRERAPCGVLFEWKMNTHAGDTEPYRKILEPRKK